MHCHSVQVVPLALFDSMDSMESMDAPLAQALQNFVQVMSQKDGKSEEDSFTCLLQVYHLIFPSFSMSNQRTKTLKASEMLRRCFGAKYVKGCKGITLPSVGVLIVGRSIFG